MGINLKKIEGEIQIFFEDRIWLPAGRDPLSRITRQVLQKTMVELVGSGINSSTHIKIVLNENWKQILTDHDISQWKDFLKFIILKEVINEHNPPPRLLPIQVVFNPEITDNYQIEVSLSSKPLKKTASLIIEEKNSRNHKIIPCYLVTPDNRVFNLVKPIVNIGRREDNELVIDNLRISRVHAQIRQIDNRHVIFDLDSTLGTKVNGDQITQRKLSHGDVIDIADISLIYVNVVEDQRGLWSGHTKVFKPNGNLS